MSGTPSAEELADYLGEGFHTAFRKASDHPHAHTIWRLISELPSDEWHRVLMFVAEPTLAFVREST